MKLRDIASKVNGPQPLVKGFAFEKWKAIREFQQAPRIENP